VGDRDLEITENIEGKVCKFFAKGRVDTNSAELLQFKLDKVLGEGFESIILNMEKIEYLSSIGIRIMLKAYKHACDNNLIFKIESPSEIVRNVLGMVALKQLLVT
jgi:anti-anti-sigma factor